MWQRSNLIPPPAAAIRVQYIGAFRTQMIDHADSDSRTGSSPSPTSSARKRSWLSRVVVTLALAAALGAGVGIGVAASPSESENQAKIDAAVAEQRAHFATEQDEAKVALADAEEEAGKAAADQAKADEARAAADTHAKEINAQLDVRAAELDEREADLLPKEAYAAKSTFGNGLHLVGEDINPGAYRTAGSSSCYWERLSGTSGEFEDIITKDLPSGGSVVTISASDVAFKSSDCGTWTKIG